MSKHQDIVDRLRAAHESSPKRIFGSNIFAEAADTIQSLQSARSSIYEECARIAEGLEALTHDPANHAMAIAAAIRSAKEGK